MKTIFIAFSLLILSKTGSSQNVWCWEITFDDTISMNRVLIDTSVQNNIWQIGIPQKSIFNSAYSLPRAILTDTINYYPNNCNFSFFIGGGYYSDAIFAVLEFKYKIDCDTINDYGKVEGSIDAGVTFNNLLPFLSVYDSNDNQINITDDTIVFTGKSNGWYTAKYLLPVVPSINDSIIFKYSFHSDSIQNNRDGWIIDNVNWGLVLEAIENKNSLFKIFPNPTDRSLNIITQEKIDKIIIENIAGQLVREIKKPRVPISINIEDLPSGIIFMKFYSLDNNLICVEKILKR